MTFNQVNMVYYVTLLASWSSGIRSIILSIPYSAERWRRKTLANQQKYCIGEKLWRITNLGDQAEIYAA